MAGITFNDPLEDAAHFGLPAVFTSSLKWLKQHALNQEGLFRKKGDARLMLQLKRSYEECGEDPIASGQVSHPYTIAALLKLWLGCLPGGVVPGPLARLACNSQLAPCHVARLELLRTVLSRAPPHVLELLFSLAEFLHHYRLNARRGALPPPDLARMFAPLLLRLPRAGGAGDDDAGGEGCIASADAAELAVAATEMLIADYRPIFTRPRCAWSVAALDPSAAAEGAPAAAPVGGSSSSSSSAAAAAAGVAAVPAPPKSPPPALMKADSGLGGGSSSSSSSPPVRRVASPSERFRKAQQEQQQQQQRRRSYRDVLESSLVTPGRIEASDADVLQGYDARWLLRAADLPERADDSSSGGGSSDASSSMDGGAPPSLCSVSTVDTAASSPLAADAPAASACSSLASPTAEPKGDADPGLAACGVSPLLLATPPHSAKFFLGGDGDGGGDGGMCCDGMAAGPDDTELACIVSELLSSAAMDFFAA